MPKEVDKDLSDIKIEAIVYDENKLETFVINYNIQSLLHLFGKKKLMDLFFNNLTAFLAIKTYLDLVPLHHMKFCQP